MRLNEKQLSRFAELFSIKAQSIIMIDKGNVITIVINNVRMFDVKRELIKEFL